MEDIKIEDGYYYIENNIVIREDAYFKTEEIMGKAVFTSAENNIEDDYYYIKDNKVMKMIGKVIPKSSENENFMILDTLVPISKFNKGQAAQIFDELSTKKEMVVLENNQPSAVLLSPDEYRRLMEIKEDYNLLLEANNRVSMREDEKVYEEAQKRIN